MASEKLRWVVESGWVGDLNRMVGKDASGMSIVQRDLIGMAAVVVLIQGIK